MSTLSEEPIVPVAVRMRATERDRLKRILSEEGFTSMSSWFWQLAILKIREAGQELGTAQPVGERG